MSRRQCSVWGCSNRKGRCLEDVQGKTRYSCEQLRTKVCPELDILVTLCNIQKMPPCVYKMVVQKLNCMRMASGGALWKPGTEGPTSAIPTTKDFRGRPNVLPKLFKQPLRQDSLCRQPKSSGDFWKYLDNLPHSMILQKILKMTKMMTLGMQNC